MLKAGDGARTHAPQLGKREQRRMNTRFPHNQAENTPAQPAPILPNPGVTGAQLARRRRLPRMTLVRGSEPKFVVYDGMALEASVWRIVPSDTPTLDDFRSYLQLGRAVVDHQFFRATGISLYESLEAARSANRRFKLGPWIAEMRLSDPRYLWSMTSGHGHITAWGNPPSFLNSVVQCVEDRG